MKTKVLLFASFRAKMGKDCMDLELPEGAIAADVLEGVCASPQEAEAWRRVMRVAVNCRYVPYDTKLADGDEIALIPPVAGG